MSGLEIAGIIISALTGLALIVSSFLVWMNFRQQRKVETLKYFSNIIPKIAEFSEWLGDKSYNEPNWLNKIIDDKPLSSKQRSYTRKIQSYLSEIELLSIAMLKEKILERVLVEDFEPDFRFQWKELESYIEWTREGNNAPKAWIEIEKLVEYLRIRKGRENKFLKIWIYMKNLVKSIIRKNSV